MGKDLLIYLSVGTVLMILLALLRRDIYRVPVWKSIVSMLFLTVMGVLGTFILYFVENGSWGGQSYFGAVLFTPILLIPIAWTLKIPYRQFLDYCAPAECAMLAVAKINCAIVGCCYGRHLITLPSGKQLMFPSALIECVAAFILILILCRMEMYSKNRNCIYFWYMLFYGALRFILNSFRGGLVPYVWILPAGHFWALVSMVIGAVLLWIQYRSKKKRV